MLIVRGNAAAAHTEQRSTTFTGTVYAVPVLPTTDGVTVNSVFFGPGARTHWHTHERGQLLHVTGGRGTVVTREGDRQTVGSGDAVWAPPGEQHWHGAAPGSSLLHLAVSLGTTRWLEEVPDADAQEPQDEQDADRARPRDEEPRMATGETGAQEHSEAFAAGLQVRREVLGAAHVDRSLAQVTDFSRPVQEWVTESGWGAVWTRPGLDRRTRSLLNLVMLTSLNRMHEFAVHVRGAVTNGCTDEEIQEALLQAALYCGAPAALESFRVAEKVLQEARGE